MIRLTKDSNTVFLTLFKDGLYDEVDTNRYWKLYGTAVEDTTEMVSETSATRSIKINSGYAVLTDTSNNQNMDIPCLYDGTPLTIEEYIFFNDTANVSNIFDTINTFTIKDTVNYGLNISISNTGYVGAGIASGSTWNNCSTKKYKLNYGKWNYIAMCYANYRLGIKINDNPIEVVSTSFSGTNKRLILTMGKDFYVSSGYPTLGGNLIGGLRISNASRYNLNANPSQNFLKYY